MTTAIATTDKNALQILAERLHVSTDTLQKTLRATAFKECKTNEEFVSAVIVANKYQLNPILKEIYAFPSKGGGITPIVSVDGWISLVNRQATYNGCTLVENFIQEKNASGTTVDSVTCSIYVKGREHAITITEYMDECFDGSKTPWKKWPRRMLRHKAYIQCARIAFGFSGIYDEDEGERILSAQTADAKEPEMPRKRIDKKEENWGEPVSSNTKTNRVTEEEYVPENTPDEEADTDTVDKCSKCKAQIPPSVSDYSLKKFGARICVDCQPEPEPEQKRFAL